jgi:hypothetical protein
MQVGVFDSRNSLQQELALKNKVIVFHLQSLKALQTG